MFSTAKILYVICLSLACLFNACASATNLPRPVVESDVTQVPAPKHSQQNNLVVTASFGEKEQSPRLATSDIEEQKKRNTCFFSGRMSTAAFITTVDLDISDDGISYEWNQFEASGRYSRRSETYRRHGKRFMPWGKIDHWEGWYGGKDRQGQSYYRLRIVEKKTGDNWLTFVAYDKRVFRCIKDIAPESVRYRRGTHKYPVY